MKKIIVAGVLSFFVCNSYAFDEIDASKLVKKYSETIACQLVDVENQKNQYKAVKINSGHPDLGNMGQQFIVYWEGDVGCSGGNGTVIPNFTIVEHRGFMSVDPIVVTDYEFPSLSLVQVTNLLGKDGLVVIEGITYGENDRQHSPTKKVLYTLKLKDNKFIIQ